MTINNSRGSRVTPQGQSWGGGGGAGRRVHTGPARCNFGQETEAGQRDVAPLPLRLLPTDCTGSTASVISSRSTMLDASDRRSKLSLVLLLLGLLFLVLAIAYHVSFIGFALVLLGASGLRDTRWQVGVFFACRGMAAVWDGYRVGEQRALAESHGSAG